MLKFVGLEFINLQADFIFKNFLFPVLLADMKKRYSAVRRGQVHFEAAIFDLDGLMLDTESVSRNGWKRAMADFGYQLDDKTYHKIIGLIVPDMKNVFRNAFGDNFPLNKINEKRLEYMHRYFDRHGIMIKPGLLQLLDFLENQKMPKAVATSSSARSANIKLTKSNLLHRFDCVVCGDDVEKGKPAPDIFLSAARCLKTSSKNCLVFEDSENGLLAAHRAGMTVLMVPDVKQPEGHIAPLAHKIFPSLTDALPYLQMLLKDK
jgi:HAD superfamily hydrolase (TIGR01509 family)